MCVCDSHFIAVFKIRKFLFIKNNFLFSVDVSLNRVFPLIKNICFLVPLSVISLSLASLGLMAIICDDKKGGV